MSTVGPIGDSFPARSVAPVVQPCSVVLPLSPRLPADYKFTAKSLGLSRSSYLTPSLLPCPFCGGEAEIRDESLPDQPNSWFFAACKDRKGCCCWLADDSVTAVAIKWNHRVSPEMQGGQQ